MSGIQLGLAGNVSLCCDIGLVGKYPKYVPKYSKTVTRWHHCGRCPGATWASLPSRHWRPCGCCPGTFAIVAVATLASLRRWHHRGCHPGAAWASLPSWHWRHWGCPPGAVANIAIATLASLRSLRWHRCQRCLGTITIVVLALSSLSRWCHPLGGIALATWMSVPFIGGGASGGLRSHLELLSSLEWYLLYPPGHATPLWPSCPSQQSCPPWQARPP
jgi:hypothetical protein